MLLLSVVGLCLRLESEIGVLLLLVEGVESAIVTKRDSVVCVEERKPRGSGAFAV